MHEHFHLHVGALIVGILCQSTLVMRSFVCCFKRLRLLKPKFHYAIQVAEFVT